MLRLAFDFIITWRETRTRPNAYNNNGETHLQTPLYLPLLFWPVLTNHSASTSFLVVLFNHTNLIRDFNAIVSLTYGLHFPMIP